MNEPTKDALRGTALVGVILFIVYAIFYAVMTTGAA